MTSGTDATPARPARARQLVFDLSREHCFDPNDFLVSAANEAAVAIVRSWPAWPQRAVLLVGPPGSGKSHLAAIWAGEAEATLVRPEDDLPASAWQGGGRRVVLEDCDRRRVEAQVFHALNLVQETRGWLMMTARTLPASWGLGTADLLSRLRLATTAMIAPPDDELMKAVLVKLFADRQIVIDQDVVAYAARHCEQSLDAARRFVAAVDEAALAESRRVTRPFAAATLSALQADEPD